MTKWDFRSLGFTKDGGQKLAPLSIDQKLRVSAYANALRTALESNVANPRFSNYFVREGIGRLGEKALPAGNIEYGLCQSLHGEESAVAAFRSARGRYTHAEDVVVGIIQPKPGEIATPCGNCRDIMLEDLGKECEIVSGYADGGIAVVASLEHYLFEDFFRLPDIYDFNFDAIVTAELGMPRMEFETWVHSTLREGERLANDAYSPADIHPERKYAVALITAQGYFIGARDIMCDYHSIYPIRDAVRQARRSGDVAFHSVVIVSENPGDTLPHVMYKDRQHLLELNIQAELTLNEERNPPVFLVAHRDGIITGLWKTSVKEWLPLPFSPYAFGPEFVEHLKNYFQKKASRL